MLLALKTISIDPISRLTALLCIIPNRVPASNPYVCWWYSPKPRYQVLDIKLCRIAVLDRCIEAQNTLLLCPCYSLLDYGKKTVRDTT